MEPQAAPNPTPDDCLNELAAIGMRAARVVVRLMEVEQAVIDLVAEALPASIVAPASATEAHVAGLSIDQMAEVMAGAVPRVDRLARALELVSRLVRRCIALQKRMEAGWPRARLADDRPAMMRRQVKRAVSEVIRRVSGSDDTAERLFDDLYERLDDPAFEQALLDWPVADIVRQVCRDLGLAVGPEGDDRSAAPPSKAGQLSRATPRATYGPPPTG